MTIPPQADTLRRFLAVTLIATIAVGWLVLAGYFAAGVMA